MKLFRGLLVPQFLLVAAVLAGETSPAVMFRGDAAHQGRCEEAPLTTLPIVKWKVALEGKVFSSPVVSGGIAYLGSGDNKFHALKTATGAAVWTSATRGAVHSSPAVADGTVYFGDTSGTFYALDAATGAEKWMFVAPGERRFGAKGLHGAQPADRYFADDWDFFLSSPVVGGGLVYFGSGNGRVYALDQKTGKEQWSFKTGEVVHGSPALAQGNLYFGGWDGVLHCVDAATGASKWRFQTGLDPVYHNQVGLQAAPVVVGNTVYLGCRDANVYALDASDGRELWRRNNKGSWVVVSPVVVGDQVCYTTSDSLQFVALDRRTGETLYTLPTLAYGFSSPVAAGTWVYCGVFNGELMAVDTAARAMPWKFRTDEARRDARGVLKPDGALDTQKIFAAQTADNSAEIFGMLFSAGAILTSPALCTDGLIFGTADGHVYCVR